MSETPRAWVGCLGCYNAGHLIGQWYDAIEAPENMEEFNEELDGIKDEKGTPAGVYVGHYSEQHEELWVFDHEGFQGLLDGECSPSTAREKAELLEGLPEEYRAAFGVYVAAGYEPETFLEAYQGVYTNEGDFAWHLLDETGDSKQIPEWALPHFDYDSYADELFSGDYWSTRTGAPHYGIYVFRGDL